MLGPPDAAQGALDNVTQMERLYRHVLEPFTKPQGYGTVATS